MGTRKRRRKNPKFQWPIANKTRKSRRNIDKKRRWKNCRSRRPNLRQQESQSTCHSTSFTRKRNAHLKKKIKKNKKNLHPRHLSAFIFCFQTKKKNSITSTTTTTKQHLVNCQFLFVSFNLS
jgi:hypothetical protein